MVEGFEHSLITSAPTSTAASLRLSEIGPRRGGDNPNASDSGR